MAADMRGATCAGTKTSKVPTEVRSLFNTPSVTLLQEGNFKEIFKTGEGNFVQNEEKL